MTWVYWIVGVLAYTAIIGLIARFVGFSKREDDT